MATPTNTAKATNNFERLMRASCRHQNCPVLTRTRLPTVCVLQHGEQFSSSCGCQLAASQSRIPKLFKRKDVGLREPRLAVSRTAREILLVQERPSLERRFTGCPATRGLRVAAVRQTAPVILRSRLHGDPSVSGAVQASIEHLLFSTRLHESFSCSLLVYTGGRQRQPMPH
jgi:hypothetical protein